MLVLASCRGWGGRRRNRDRRRSAGGCRKLFGLKMNFLCWQGLCKDFLAERHVGGIRLLASSEQRHKRRCAASHIFFLDNLYFSFEMKTFYMFFPDTLSGCLQVCLKAREMAIGVNNLTSTSSRTNQVFTDVVCSTCSRWPCCYCCCCSRC